MKLKSSSVIDVKRNCKKEGFVKAETNYRYKGDVFFDI